MEKYLQISKKSANENIEEDSDDGEPVPKKTRKTSSDVWKIFDAVKEQNCAKCRLCGKMYKTSGNTTNLLDHLKRSHPTFKEMQKPNNAITSFFEKNETYGSGSERKRNLDRALMSMIAIDVQPFSIVEDSGFRDFVKCLNPRYGLPSRTTLQNKMMVELYNNTRNKLRSILDEIEHCAITADCWTSRANEGYLTVTCHFITNDFVLRTAVLSTQKLLTATNHNAENISKSLQAVLDEWGVMTKVTSIVTDNATTMIKACDLLQKRHLPCFAHTLNLVVQNCLALSNIKEVLTKCKRIVTYVKSSTVAYEKFKAEQGMEKAYSLIQEVPTRWNSALKMVERILLTNCWISKVLLATPKAPPPITADDIAILNDIKELLTPFETATTQTSSSTSVTISLIIPITCGLFQALEGVKPGLKTFEGQHACTFLTENLRTRLFPYEERPAASLGTLLDPRFKREGFFSTTNADNGSELLKNELKFISQRSTTYLQNIQPSTSKSVPNQGPQPCLLKFVQHKVANKVIINQMDDIVSLRQYFENGNSPMDSDPLQYWKNIGIDMSTVKSCALKYLCIPATSTESERMFSKTGAIISDRRSRLKPKTVDKLLFINKNFWITSYLK